MAYMGQVLKSPVLNKIASQVKSQGPLRTEWAQGWESSEDAERKLEAHNRGPFLLVFAWVILNSAFPSNSIQCLPPTTITKRKGLVVGFLGVKSSDGSGSLCYSAHYYLWFWQIWFFGSIFLYGTQEYCSKYIHVLTRTCQRLASHTTKTSPYTVMVRSWAGQKWRNSTT